MRSIYRLEILAGDTLVIKNKAMQVLWLAIDDNKIESFSLLSENSRLIKFKIFFQEEKELSLDIVLFDEEVGVKDIVLNNSFSSNACISIKKSCRLERLETKIINFLDANLKGFKSEKELFDIFSKFIIGKDSKFLSVRKATKREDLFEHADLYLTYKISQTNTKEIPFDCKSSVHSQVKFQNKYGYSFPTINLEKVREDIKLDPEGNIFLEKIRNITKNYISQSRKNRKKNSFLEKIHY